MNEQAPAKPESNNPVELYKSLSVAQISIIENLANKIGLPSDLLDLIEISIEFEPENEVIISELLSEMVFRPAEMEEFAQRAAKLIKIIE